MWHTLLAAFRSLLAAASVSESHRLRLARQAAGTFGMTIVNLGLMFVSAILWARVLGTASYGTYVYCLSWSLVLMQVGMLGVDRLLLRETATYHVRQEWSLLRGLIGCSLTAAILFALLLAGAGCGLGWWLASAAPAEQRFSLLLAFSLVPLWAAAGVVASVQHGLRQVLLARIPELIVKPLLILALLGVCWWSAKDRLTAATAMGVQLLATAITLAVAGSLLWLRLPPAVRIAIPQTTMRVWVNAAVPLFLLACLTVVQQQIEVLLMGILRPAEEAGIFSVARRAAQLTSLPLLAVNAALAPTITRFLAVGDLRRVQLAITHGMRGAVLVAVPIAVTLLVLGDWLLALFGAAFAEGRWPLRILVVAQLFQCATGAAVLVLVNSNREWQASIGFALAIVTEVLLALALIPTYEATGAALAAAAGTLVISLSCVGFVRHELGIRSTALATLD